MSLLQGDSCKHPLIANEINAQWQKRLGLEGVGGVGGGCILKLLLLRGVQFSYVIIFLGGKVLIHFFFLDPLTPRLVPKTNKVFPEIIIV